MTLGVTGVVWLPRTAMVNSTALLAGAGPAPLATASGAWQSVAAAYTDTSVTITRVMAVLAAGWEGEAANAAQARLGAFLGWTQASAGKAADIAVHAASEAAAYTTASIAMPNPVEIGMVQAARTAVWTSGGALNGSAQALETVSQALDVRAGIVMDAYEAATTPLAFPVSFDRPPEIVNDAGASAGSTGSIDDATSFGAGSQAAGSDGDTGVFGFGARTSPAQAAIAAISAAVQNPAVTGAVGQFASSAGTVAGSSVTTVASAVTNLGGSAVSTLMSTQSTPQQSAHTLGAVRGDSAAPGLTATRAVSTGANGPSAVGARLAGTLGLPGSTLGPPAHTVIDANRTPFGPNTSGTIGAGPADGAAATRGTNGGAPMSGTRPGDGDEEHVTPGYLKQFEHFSDGRTVAPSVIGADPTWNDR
ncbi:PPE domain-containing protein [Rhodococcoides yunnanense]|uniref:PPE domain-containing protein n=1 Tax=Rhodococcoides yunnanense TaxID=278209 RepID=UPI0009346299|nr:PPE domain-containing protein [Rhodococcus yunnanensis]